jgi:DNA-binding NtrC family response regulator
LSDFARDLAARLQRALPGRPARIAQSTSGLGGRRPSVSIVKGSLGDIAGRLLGMNLPNPMEAIEIALLASAMTSAEGNITAASRILGIHRKAVERLVTKHKLKRSNRPGRRPPRARVSGTGRRKKRR